MLHCWFRGGLVSVAISRHGRQVQWLLDPVERATPCASYQCNLTVTFRGWPGNVRYSANHDVRATPGPVQINEFLLKCSSPPFPILSLICLMLPMISKFTHRRQHSGAVNLATSNIIPHTTMYAPRPVLLLFSVVSAIRICTVVPLAACDL